MDPVYDRTGGVIAWQRGVDLYHLNGSHAAFVNGQNIYGHNGKHLGVYKNGIFRDNQGGVVAFVRGASGGPILPITAISPIPPISGIPPIPSIPSIPPIPPIPSLDWGIQWKDFINR